ncbi:MAG: hypothetical protein ACLR1R_08560 [Ruminococcus callidus]
MCYKVKYHTKITHQQNSPGGVTGGLSAVTLPFLHLKLGRKVSGDPPLSLLKRKKEAKKEKSSHSTCTIRSNITRRLHVAKIPRRGEQAAAAAVTLPFLLLKLGRRVGGDPPRRKVGGDPPRRKVSGDSPPAKGYDNYDYCF